MLEARLAKDGQRLRCGRSNCRGVLAEVYHHSTLSPPKLEVRRWSKIVALSYLFVRRTDSDGVYYEEPSRRRQARLRGDRSEHHIARPRKPMDVVDMRPGGDSEVTLDAVTSPYRPIDAGDRLTYESVKWEIPQEALPI